MKPAWDKLGAEYEGSSSVVIGDADCTASGKELCDANGVSGYPTIKYFDAEGEHKYSGPRDYDGLKAFVSENLEQKCTIEEQDKCTEKETKYIAKMQAADAEKVTAQLARLEKMMSKPMKKSLKAWVSQRLAILKQL